MVCPRAWGAGGHLAEFKAQLAEEMNNKFTAQENHIKELQAKFDGQATAVGIMKGDISKVSSETKAGRDIINDSQVMRDYIQSMRDSHKEVVDINWKIINGLLIQIGALVLLLGWCLKSLLRARDKDSEADDALIAEQMSKKEG